MKITWKKKFTILFRGFQFIIPVKDKKIEFQEDMKMKLIFGSDLSYIIGGKDVSYELFNKVLFEGDIGDTYAYMFLQVVKELYHEKEINGNKILIPRQDVKNLLSFWTGNPIFLYLPNIL